MVTNGGVCVCVLIEFDKWMWNSKTKTNFIDPKELNKTKNPNLKLSKYSHMPNANLFIYFLMLIPRKSRKKIPSIKSSIFFPA